MSKNIECLVTYFKYAEKFIKKTEKIAPRKKPLHSCSNFGLIRSRLNNTVIGFVLS